MSTTEVRLFHFTKFLYKHTPEGVKIKVLFS